jgi:alginate O-acetyltransferase complex protein AlgI
VNAYLANDGATAERVGLILLGLLAAGLAVTRLRWANVARLAAWLLTIISVVAVEWLTAFDPAGFRMLTIIAALLLGMKAVVTVEHAAAGRPRLRPVAWLLFAAGWLGMRPGEFAQVPARLAPPHTTGRMLRGAGDLIRRGLVRLSCGLALMFAARWAWHWSDGVLSETGRWTATMALLLPGVSLVLHFGLVNLLAGFWRRFGADSKALFRAPLRATSLAEFWGRRWNLAFSEMTAVSVFRPLRNWIGTRGATAAAFLFSGVLHELAISLPVKAGFGLPMLYFALHAVAVMFEDSLAAAGWAVDRRPWLGRAWAAAWLLLPLPLLFHPAFLRGCVAPLIGIGG